MRSTSGPATVGRWRADHAAHLALNVSGIVLPVVAGILSIPTLVRQLGQEGFATLALGWTVVGYFSLLDLGLGRALTVQLARGAADDVRTGAPLAWTGQSVMLGLGAVWTMLLLGAFPLVDAQWPVLSMQTASPMAAWVALVLCIPFTLWLNSSAGVLEARSRFVQANAVRIPLGVATYLAPLLTALVTKDMGWIFASMLMTRIAGAVVMWWQVRAWFTAGPTTLRGSALRALLRFGGWMTVSQVVGPVLVYADRFAIAALISAAAVTSYTVPFDVLTRLPAFAAAVLMVLFPLFVRFNAAPLTTSPMEGSPTGRSTLLLLLAVWLPGMAIGAVFGPTLLGLWVGGDLAAASSPVWQWLIVGVTVNGLAQFPLLLLQSRERTDVIAAIHLLELVPYLLVLGWALQQYGVVGAAMAWTARCAVDAIALHAFARRMLPRWKALLDLYLGVSLIALGALGALAWSRA